MAHENQLGAVEDYINGLQNKLRCIKERSYATGNEMLDIIVNYYFESLESVDFHVSGVCKKLPEISDIDLCIILSNLIQNAVEAVTRQKGNGRFIELHIEQGKEYIKVSIKNSLDEQSVLNQESGKKTSKNEEKNHGFSLRNIKLAVERNHGIFEIHSSIHTFEAVLYFELG